jgi:hypothetical protein
MDNVQKYNNCNEQTECSVIIIVNASSSGNVVFAVSYKFPNILLLTIVL